jgi:hypothetical protein
MDHFLDSAVPPEERLTHLMFMHIGHHGYGSDLEARVADRWAQAQAAALEIGLPLIRVDSSAPDFYPPEHDSPLRWADTCTVRAAAGPLLLQRGFRRYLLASSFSWGFIGVRPYRYLSIADPILLPALGTETLDLAAVGTELTRVGKTRRIAGMDLAQKFLDVCTMEAGVNCSRCEKCMRTLFTLDLLGQLQAFRDRFDLEAYRGRKTVFVARILTGPAMVLHKELRKLMDQVGYRPSVPSRLLALALRLWSLIPWGLRKRIRGLGR